MGGRCRCDMAVAVVAVVMMVREVVVVVGVVKIDITQ